MTMGKIGFTAGQWGQVRQDYGRWWAGELDRPLIAVTLTGGLANQREPVLPHKDFAAWYDLAVPAEAIVERWDYELSQKRFLGDAFPGVWPNFGPGVIAAFLGCKVVNSETAGTTWFEPEKPVTLESLEFRYDAGNVWFRRVGEIMRAAVERWQGTVQVGMTDLGGNLDVLSSFVPGEPLLFALCDQPEPVKALTWKVHELWARYFEELNAIVSPVNPGYTAWTEILSPEPYYILQCDFAYMIGPDMFEEFVLPELQATCKRLANPFFHLDGPGMLTHLDALLAIPELKGIQWVPGAGAKPMDEWVDVYRRIRAAGKLMQVLNYDSDWDLAAERFNRIVAGLGGDARGIYWSATTSVSQEDKVRTFLDTYGVDSDKGLAGV